MRLSELQNKNIVNLIDGKNIGSIIDVKIDSTSGKIISLIIEPNRNIFSFIGKNEDTEIKWEHISKIGQDVILVDMSL